MAVPIEEFVSYTINKEMFIILPKKLTIENKSKLSKIIEKISECCGDSCTIDAKNLKIIDSAGLGAIIKNHKYLADKSITLRIMGIDKYLRDIFERARLMNILEIVDDDD